MKIRAKAPFLDLQENVDRAAGEVFECSEERFVEINSTQFGTLAERVDEQPAQAEEPARKPSRRQNAAAAAGKAGEE